MFFIAPGSVAGSPEFKELLGTQSGNERMGQLCHGSCLPQFQPVVDTSQGGHPLRAEQPSYPIEEDEAQHRRKVRMAFLPRQYSQWRSMVAQKNHTKSRNGYLTSLGFLALRTTTSMPTNLVA